MDPKNERAPIATAQFQCRNHTGAFVTIAMVLAFLLVADLYVLNKQTVARQDLADLDAKLSREVEGVKSQNLELLLKYSVLKSSQASQIERLRIDLDTAARQLGVSTSQVLDQARTRVASMQKQLDRRSNDLELRLADKAGTDDLASLNETFSAAQYDLESTEKAVDSLSRDLAETREKLGGMIEDTHDQIQSLHQQREKDYHELQLVKDGVYQVGYVNLILKKTNTRMGTFNINLITHDQEICVKGRNVLEPVYFYVGEAQAPHELVITRVNSKGASGYLRMPKYEIPPSRRAPQT